TERGTGCTVCNRVWLSHRVARLPRLTAIGADLPMDRVNCRQSANCREADRIASTNRLIGRLPDNGVGGPILCDGSGLTCHVACIADVDGNQTVVANF